MSGKSAPIRPRVSEGPSSDTDSLVDAHHDGYNDGVESPVDLPIDPLLEAKLTRKLDLRLCTIAGLLFSLDLLDSNIISSAAVTSMIDDLKLYGNRYSIAIWVFTVSSIAFQLPSTIAVRRVRPRLWFSCVTCMFGIITLCTAFIRTWREMIALRVLLGISMSSIYPGLTYLISTWYTRKEQQLRFAYLQTGEVFVLATGTILNFGLQKLNGQGGLAGWRWIFLVQGLLAVVLGLLAYFWIIDFPEDASSSWRFLDSKEIELAVTRIQRDRGDSNTTPFSWHAVLQHAGDIKTYGFAIMFFLLNLISTGLSYFLPIILQSGLSFSTDQAILLSAPPYYYAILPVIVTSYISDRYSLRGPTIAFNSICVIVGFCMLGFSRVSTVRYIGTFLATGAYVSNWAALSAYYQNNIVGQWKRVFVAAVVTAFNGAGGVAGSFIFRQEEAPRYLTAIWVSIGSHVAMILCVGLFSIFFWRQNMLQNLGKKKIENTPGFRYTY